MHAARKSVVEDGLTPPTRAAPLDCAAKLRARGECCRGVLLHDRFRTLPRHLPFLDRGPWPDRRRRAEPM